MKITKIVIIMIVVLCLIIVGCTNKKQDSNFETTATNIEETMAEMDNITTEAEEPNVLNEDEDNAAQENNAQNSVDETTDNTETEGALEATTEPPVYSGGDSVWGSPGAED